MFGEITREDLGVPLQTCSCHRLAVPLPPGSGAGATAAVDVGDPLVAEADEVVTTSSLRFVVGIALVDTAGVELDSTYPIGTARRWQHGAGGHVGG